MKILVIGDVHGCYYTLKALVEKHWQPDEAILIQVGDIINKGKHSAACVGYMQHLERSHPGKVIMIRGNHEQMFIEAHDERHKPEFYIKRRRELFSIGLDPDIVNAWFRAKPLKWEDEHYLVSHGGISKTCGHDPFDEENENGVLYHKDPLKRMQKTQIIGHTIVEGGKPLYSTHENAWRIDTGAWNNGCLTGILLGNQGRGYKIYSELLHPLDKHD